MTVEEKARVIATGKIVPVGRILSDRIETEYEYGVLS